MYALEPFIPVINLLVGGMDMHQQILQILVDQEGIVEKYILSDTDSDINAGLLNSN